MDLIPLNDNEFKSMDVESLFEETEFDAKYAAMTNGKVTFKISWRSDLIDPLILHLKDNCFFIGIDLVYAIVDFDNDKIINTGSENSFFLEAYTYQNILLIFFEMKLIIYCNEGFSRVGELGFPDIYTDSKIDKKILKISFMNGENKLVNLAQYMILSDGHNIR